jgi:hypothetical protein
VIALLRAELGEAQANTLAAALTAREPIEAEVEAVPADSLDA